MRLALVHNRIVAKVSDSLSTLNGAQEMDDPFVGQSNKKTQQRYLNIFCSFKNTLNGFQFAFVTHFHFPEDLVTFQQPWSRLDLIE